MSVRRLDAGELELGGGLEVLVAAALEGIAPGGEIDVALSSRAAAFELPAWSRLGGHEVTGESVDAGGWVVRVRRGAGARVLGGEAPARGAPPGAGDGRLGMADLRAAHGPPPARAARDGGLVPLGALAEPGAGCRTTSSGPSPR